ncbi:hypothetical protein AB0L47_14535 [Streptomyces bobili]
MALLLQLVDQEAGGLLGDLGLFGEVRQPGACSRAGRRRRRHG